MNALPLILALVAVAGVESSGRTGLQGIVNHDHGSCQTGASDETAVQCAIEPKDWPPKEDFCATAPGAALAQVQQGDALLTNQKFCSHCKPDCGMFWAGDPDKFPRSEPSIGDMLLANCMTKANELAEAASSNLGAAMRILVNRFNTAIQREPPSITLQDTPKISVSVDGMFEVARELKYTQGTATARKWFSRALLTYTVFEYHKTHSLFITDYINREFGNRIQDLFPGETWACRLFDMRDLQNAPPKNLVMREEDGLIGVAVASDEPDEGWSVPYSRGEKSAVKNDMTNLPDC